VAACYDKSCGFVMERRRGGLDEMLHMNTPFSYSNAKLGCGLVFE
jgi:hypothetical protein